MFALKFPALLPRPNRADRSVLPALLTALLALMVGLQFFLPEEAEPQFLPGRAVVPIVGGQASPLFLADPAIVNNALFAPGRGRGKTAAIGPLDGATFVGVVRGKGFARAVLQQPDGQAVSVPVGGSYRGWRLISLVNANATFMRDNVRHRVAVARGAIVTESVVPPP